MSELYDVVAVNLKTRGVRLIAAGKTLGNAEAIISMAVARRGAEDEVFAGITAGKYEEGDEWDQASNERPTE